MASANNWLGVSLSNNLTVDMQGSGGHENQSTSRNNMAVTSSFAQQSVGYNNTDAHRELPSNSIPLTLERHNVGPLSFMEALNGPNNGGFQSDQPDEAQGYNSLEQPHNIYGPSSNFMRLQTNNCPAASDEMNIMSNATNSFLSTAITTAPVTTTTAKVQPGPRAMHEDLNYMNVNWLMMNQASEDRSKLNNNANTAGDEAAKALMPSIMQNLSNNNNQAAYANDCDILSGYGLQLPQGSGRDVYGLPNVNWVVRSQASEEANMNDPINFPAHITASTTTSAAKEINSNGDSPSSTDGKKRTFEDADAIVPFESTEPIQSRAADRSLGNRTSIYRGVTRHRWTGRYEAHLWDSTCRRENQTRKGRQVYLGGYDQEEKAARAYDMAALKYWGPGTTTNFPINQYKDALEEMQHLTRQEYVASIKRKSSGFSRGASQYRGVTRHHQHGRWQARIGRVAGNKDLYLGTFRSEKEAAEAYDIAAIKFRGPSAVTNFEMSKYDLKTIENCVLPIGAAKRLKAEAETAVEGSANNGRSTDEERTLSSQTDATSYIGNAARTEFLPLISLQQQSNPSQVAYELQKVPLYNQDLRMKLHNVNQQKYIQASGSTHELHNLISLGSAVNNNNNNASISTPGNYTNSSNALAINDLLVANPSDRRAVIFGENSEGSAAAKSLTFGNMLMPLQQFARNNLYYLPQQQSPGLANVTSDNLAYSNGMEARPNLKAGHAPIFSVFSDSQG